MKTQLLPLESHDDLISIRDRMSWAKTPRILLVWPKSERIPLRPLDLKVLQRHAATLGAQLGLVTRHRTVRREAQALGIPVFVSTGQAQRKPWPERTLRGKRPRRRPRPNLREKREQLRIRDEAWINHPLARIGFFSLGVLAVLLLASLFIPRARVILTPETESQSATLPILADPSAKSVFITGTIPARELRLTVDGSQESSVTGKVPVPQDTARGAVTFRNLTQAPVSIPLGTVLTSTGLPGVRFLTLRTVQLEGGLQETADVPVQAEKPGRAGNVEAGAIQGIEGNLGLQVTVTNEEPTSGGSDRLMEAASDRDLARLREDLMNELKEQALEAMKAELAPGDQIFIDTLQADQILNEEFDPPPGAPGQDVTLTMQVEFVASYASEADLTELASTVLNASLPEGFVTTQAPLQFEPLNARLTDERGVTRWSVRVSRPLEKRLDVGQVIPLTQGRSLADALANLEAGLDLSNPPDIRLQPKWWPWMPLIPFNISVEIQ